MNCSEIQKESLGFLMHDATRLIRREFERLAADHGLTSAQWRLLVHLLRNGPLPQARLAELLEIEPISVSRMVDRMEDGAWVTRSPDPNDRRIRIVELTEKAQEILPQARIIADDLYARALSGFSQPETEAMFSSLRRLIANLSENDHVR